MDKNERTVKQRIRAIAARIHKVLSKMSFKQVVSYALVAIIFFAFGLKAADLNIDFFSGGQNAGLPAQLNYSSVNQLYRALKQNYDGKITEQELLDGMKNGMVSALGDPYTDYFTASEAQSFNDDLNEQFSGIGAQLAEQNNQAEIVSPLKGFPAQQAGLQTGDIILSVNGKSVSGWSIDQVVDAIRGPSGTTVTLQISRNNQTMTYHIKRETITVPSVNWSISNGIGYMQITSFATDTSSLAQQAAKDFKSNNVKGVILDLRGNGGGYLQAGVNVASLWLPSGQEIVQERDGNTVVDTLYATGNDILNGIPTAVLVDGGSASASEIVSGALQDHHDATLIGEQTFGKGSVQQIINLDDGSELKVTVAKWYTPNGQNINKKGITPNIIVPMSTADVQSNNDVQKARAIEFLQTGR
jgi:carboxyl-terminal processing protease